MSTLLISSNGIIVGNEDYLLMSFAAKQVEDFFHQYKIRKYSKGHILIFSGDQPEYVFYLVEGRVKQYDVTYRGDEITLNVFTPPAFFPMSLAINKNANVYTYEAETDVVIRQAPASDVVTFLKANPDVQFDLLSRLYRGVDGLLSRMAHLMASSAKERLMFELVIACRRFGKIEKGSSYSLVMNETDIGARAGLSRETVSREMSKLEKEGVLTFRAGKVVLHDFAAFEQKLTKAT